MQRISLLMIGAALLAGFAASAEAQFIDVIPQHAFHDGPKSGGATAIRVIDGDTIVLAGEHIRLFGVDAPEKTQRCLIGGTARPCGAFATDFLRILISRGTVTCDRRSQDRYRRTVAVCFAGGRDLGMEMVRAGWAVAFVRYSTDYIPEENEARVARRGVWEGQFEQPSEWRAKRRAR